MDSKLKQRIYSIDLLRGVVMMLMLLDHTRDFVHAGAFQSDPTDLSRGDAMLFLTRWITHFCAPTFVFLSGISIYLQRMYGKPTATLARFLFTRGLWLVFLEFTLVRFGFAFNVDYSFFGVAQVIWVIGVSMMVMAGLIWLPLRLVGAIGLAMILFHNLLDGILVPANIAFAGQPPPDLSQMLWIILHQPGVIPLGEASSAFVAYPLIPWIGVMALGYAVGAIYSWESTPRRKWLMIAGIGVTVLFFAIRTTNIYGDPAPWKPQDTPIFSLLSILNTTKYPPSLLFLMMTLGPAMIALSLLDRIDGKAIWQRIAIVYGRVPMFYYLLQFPLAHALAILLSLAVGKSSVAHYFMNFPASMMAAPPDAGFPLWVVYVMWIVGLAILYPLCLRYGNYKLRKKHWLLSYL